MSRTDKYRTEHNQLLEIANELQSHLHAERLTTEANAASGCLNKLMGKLVLHLSVEDKALYPALAASTDPAVAALGKRFQTEMASTVVTVTAYNKKWSTPSAIKGDPKAFIAETKQVLTVLANRIRRENQELYAAADRMASTV